MFNRCRLSGASGVCTGREELRHQQEGLVPFVSRAITIVIIPSVPFVSRAIHHHSYHHPHHRHEAIRAQTFIRQSFPEQHLVNLFPENQFVTCLYPSSSNQG